jgi:hypothetical protein
MHLWQRSIVRGIVKAALAAQMAVLFGIALYPVSTAASTIVQTSLSELAKAAELVFEGTVTASTVEPNPSGQGIRTCVTFNIVEVIAGSHPDPTLVLCFQGGELNGQRMVVTDVHYPVIGEHGIYLVESTHTDMVNPLIGWDQGRYLVTADPAGGPPKMLTAARRPVMGVGGPVAHAVQGTAILPDGGTASDVRSSDGPDLNGAVTRDAFKAKLRALAGH